MTKWEKAIFAEGVRLGVNSVEIGAWKRLHQELRTDNPLHPAIIVEMVLGCFFTREELDAAHHYIDEEIKVADKTVKDLLNEQN